MGLRANALIYNFLDFERYSYEGGIRYETISGNKLELACYGKIGRDAKERLEIYKQLAKQN